METIQVPRELLWDYKEPPDDLLWRLQRIVDFFPAYGTERRTIKLLMKYRHKLKLEEGTEKLIVLYNEVWNEKTHKSH